MIHNIRAPWVSLRLVVLLALLPVAGMLRAADFQPLEVTNGLPPVALWIGAVPYGLTNTAVETVDQQGKIRGVSAPSITAFLPPEVKRNGTAIIVCAGGGYGSLDWKTHVIYAAQVFNELGVTVIGLKYRLRPPHIVSNEEIQSVTLLDAKRAVRVVRQHASEWGIDTHKIGIVGYSAGANLAMNLAASFDDGAADAQDPVERQSSRPDFAVGLGVWNWRKPENPFVFRTNSPPVYLVHATTDKPIEIAQNIVADLRKLGVPARLDLFDEGGHGLGNLIPARVEHDFPPSKWPHHLLAWLREIEK